MEISSDLRKRLKDRFDGLIDVRWGKSRVDPSRECWGVYEKRRNGVLESWHHIFDYSNVDGTFTPLSSEHLIETISDADVRRWPLAERMRLLEEEIIAVKEKAQRDFREKLVSDMKEDEAYFTTKNRFFMDPSSMPEWKSSFRPSQYKILRNNGVI